VQPRCNAVQPRCATQCNHAAAPRLRARALKSLAANRVSRIARGKSHDASARRMFARRLHGACTTYANSRTHDERTRLGSGAAMRRPGIGDQRSESGRGGGRGGREGGEGRRRHGEGRGRGLASHICSLVIKPCAHARGVTLPMWVDRTPASTGMYALRTGACMQVRHARRCTLVVTRGRPIQTHGLTRTPPHRDAAR
jgi:hypothetical protein